MPDRRQTENKNGFKIYHSLGANEIEENNNRGRERMHRESTKFDLPAGWATGDDWLGRAVPVLERLLGARHQGTPTASDSSYGLVSKASARTRSGETR